MADPVIEAARVRPAVQGAVYHGGALAQVRAAHPNAPEPWIDLSTGINPEPWPVPPLSEEAWTRLPEPALVTDLERTAAAAFGVADPASVAATPGTQAAIQMLPRLISGRRLAILGFTYQEHSHVWREAGREVTVVESLEELAAADVGLLVNPNNPDGRRVPVDRLVDLAGVFAKKGGTLIVDEAFADADRPPQTLAPILPEGAVVLRSFGKTWGLAGLRLGFVLGRPAFADAVRRAFGPWAVSGPAVEIGAAALTDAAWLEATRIRLEADALRLDDIIAGAGFAFVGGTPLFRLYRHPRALAIADRLAEAGIHVRRFPHDPTLLRFGLPGAEAEWRRLAAALAG